MYILGSSLSEYTVPKWRRIPLNVPKPGDFGRIILVVIKDVFCNQSVEEFDCSCVCINLTITCHGVAFLER